MLLCKNKPVKNLIGVSSKAVAYFGNIRISLHQFCTVALFKIKNIFVLLLLFMSLVQTSFALTGTRSVGKGWQSVVYIEFSFKKDPDKIACTGFLINDSQVISAGHCAYKDEGRSKASSAMVCIGSKRPFNNAGEVCITSKRIRLASRYAYGSSNNVSLIDLSEKIPLNFLGINLTKILPAAKAEKLFKDPKSSKGARIVSFGSRQFNHPTLGKKGWAKVNKLHWNKIDQFWSGEVPKSSFAHADDGAGLFVQFRGSSTWWLAGILVKARPDFFTTVDFIVDPCAPPQPPPRQPSILLTSQFQFTSINLLACRNRFLARRYSSDAICQGWKFNRQQLETLAVNSADGGVLALQLAQLSKSKRERFSWLSKASEQGSSRAKFQLAKIYLKGLGVKTDNKRAMHLLLTSAELGLPKAEYRVSQLLRANSSVFKSENNDLSWMDWMIISAKKGFPAAQYDYAMHLFESNGKGVYDWFMRAARQGYAPAQFMLATLYQDGYGVKKNTKISYQWMEYSAGQGYYDAIKWLQRHPKAEYEVYDDEFE